MASNSTPVPVSAAHLCETCEKPPRKNQLSVKCMNCKDLYFKTCPILNITYAQFKRLPTTHWHCPPCRKSMSKTYCTLCSKDKNVILLECSACENKYHSDCVGDVKLGVIDKDIESWKCTKCSKSEGSENLISHQLEKFFLNLNENNGMKILYVNINSMLEKFSKLKEFLIKNKVDVLGICETKLCGSDAEDNFQIDGYQLIRRDRDAMELRSKIRGGGLAIYVRSKPKPGTTVISEGRENNIEFLVVKIGKRNDKMVIILVYSPQPNNKHFVGLLQRLIHETKGKSKKIFIMGDINIDLLREDLRMGDRVKNCFIDEGFYPLVNNRPTRVTKTSAKMIDILFTNCDRKLMDLESSDVVNLEWSDHYLLFGNSK